MPADLEKEELKQDASAPAPKAAASRDAEDFSREADLAEPGFFEEFWDFLVHNKKWWMAPIIIVMLLVGLLIVLANSAAAPFIYTIF